MLSVEWLQDFETNMRLISEDSYSALNAPENTWWTHIARVRPSKTKVERLAWFIQTAQIKESLDGSVDFDDLGMIEYDIRHAFANVGLEVNRSEFEDLDGNGVKQAVEWAAQVGAYAAYWPQRTIAKALIANSKSTYDGLPLFHTSHPINPNNVGAGVFANLWTGAAVPGVTPGALPINGTLESAIDNLALARAFIRQIKIPNGDAPRSLKLEKIIVPPKLFARAVQITDAKLIAQAAQGGGGGSANIEGVIRSIGLGHPIEAPELAADFGGSDTDYYLACKEIGTGDLGAVEYVEREPFNVEYHDERSSADFIRQNKLQWVMRGRNGVAPGHPYKLFKVRAA